MPNTYTPAPEIRDLAQDIIHAHHKHLAEVRIDYVWRSEPVRRRDQLDWGKASKLSGLNAFLAREDEKEFNLTPCEPPKGFFVIEVYRQGFDMLDDKAKAKVLDHLLSFLSAEEISDKSGRNKISLSVNAPDVYEFLEVDLRHKGVDFGNILVRAAAEQKKARPASETAAVIGANGKPRPKKRPKKDYEEPKAGVSKEQRAIGDSVFTLAVTPDGSEFQFMIAARGADGEERVCVAGRRAESVAAAKQFFEEYISEHEVGAGA